MGLLEGVDTRSVGWWRSSALCAVARGARFFAEFNLLLWYLYYHGCGNGFLSLHGWSFSVLTRTSKSKPAAIATLWDPPDLRRIMPLQFFGWLTLFFISTPFTGTAHTNTKFYRPLAPAIWHDFCKEVCMCFLWCFVQFPPLIGAPMKEQLLCTFVNILFTGVLMFH